MTYKNIIKKTTSNIGYIIINRPKNLNALNKETIIELNHLIQDFDSNKNIRSIIITGAEKKAFIAGADIKEFMFFDQENGQELAKNGQVLLFDLIENLSKPCIAAINGFALGGGLELAMSCHIRVASINSKMGLPEVSLGVIPGYGGTQRLSQLVGKGKALEMIVSGSMISSDDALKWGLVNYVCSQDELIEKCEYIANKISFSGIGIHTGKKVKGITDINKYFNEYDENGNFRRFVGAFQPIYMAGYIMDKFAFNDIVFNVGLRVDVFDANQPDVDHCIP